MYCTHKNAKPTHQRWAALALVGSGSHAHHPPCRRRHQQAVPSRWFWWRVASVVTCPSHEASVPDVVAATLLAVEAAPAAGVGTVLRGSVPTPHPRPVPPLLTAVPSPGSRGDLTPPRSACGAAENRRRRAWLRTGQNPSRHRAPLGRGERTAAMRRRGTRAPHTGTPAAAGRCGGRRRALAACCGSGRSPRCWGTPAQWAAKTAPSAIVRVQQHQHTRTGTASERYHTGPRLRRTQQGRT